MIIAQYSAHNGENANPLASQKRQGGLGYIYNTYGKMVLHYFTTQLKIYSFTILFYTNYCFLI